MSYSVILFRFHCTLGVVIRPSDVARIKKDQDGLFWDRVDTERGLITSTYFMYFQVMLSHVPARGVPRQQKEREDLADGVTAMPAWHMSCFLRAFHVEIRCYTVAFVVHLLCIRSACSRKFSRRCCQAMISPADILLVSFCLSRVPDFWFHDLWRMDWFHVCVQHRETKRLWKSEELSEIGRFGRAMRGPLWDWPFEDHACGRMPGSKAMESHGKPKQNAWMFPNVPGCFGFSKCFQMFPDVSTLQSRRNPGVPGKHGFERLCLCSVAASWWKNVKNIDLFSEKWWFTSCSVESKLPGFTSAGITFVLPEDPEVQWTCSDAPCKGSSFDFLLDHLVEHPEAAIISYLSLTNESFIWTWTVNASLACSMRWYVAGHIDLHYVELFLRKGSPKQQMFVLESIDD